MATPCDPIQAVFDTTIRDFRARLKNETLYREILQTTTIDQVYDATDKLQEEQAQKGQLRHLSKIEPYLEGLRSYASVIEVFMQAKPDILALIWGPIKLLLQWASNLKYSLDAIINITAEIGSLLPEFRKAAHLFSHNAPVKEVLALFFRDILDFYVIALGFFSLPRWKYLFESVWPKHRDKIKIVTNHIERHTLLLRNEVRLEHIQAEHDARTRALEHFESIEESSQRQEFHSIMADISPPTYEDKLDYVDGRMCHGTGKWLLKDTTFTTWLKNTDTSTKVLWLQGIPGSGKTFLSGTAIHETRKAGHSMFAFLSYAISNHASALKIMQSLIFQLASDDKHLKDIVCQSSRSNLKSSISATKDLFLKLIRAAGAVYITIDGLDEIDGVERSRLLKNLLQLVEESDEAKMLISCRPEADITGLLKDKSSILRVDNRNSGSIQRFITEYMRNWFRERDFLPQAQSEIERLLAPLASKSKGMFLYAKVVLSSIEHLDIEEIQDDIQVLPDTLDDAYGRVLARINGLAPPTLKEKARKLLGWIGATPTPLTVQEIEQALTIKLEDVEGKARVLARVNIIEICGPIVEVVDDYVQFVHFTVQEYFFSPQVLGSIDAGESKLSLAMCCVMYLCQGHHDPEISSEDSLHNTLTGAYSLHDFASTMWLELTEQLASESCSVLSELVSLLETLICERANDQHDGTDEQVTSPTLDALKGRWPHVYAVLCDAFSFRKLSLKSDFRKSQIASWSHLDPLTISNTSARIHDHHETLLLDTTNNKKGYLTLIHRHYGKRPFKCDYVNCSFRRHGFESASLRRTHLGYHSRPWKCTFPGCEYEDGGFLTRKMQAEHLNQFHQGRAKDSSVMEKPDADEIQPLLFDLVKANKVEIVKGLLEEVLKLPGPTQGRLAECAARFGTPSMVELFPITESLLEPAVQGKNPETFRYISSKLGAEYTWDDDEVFWIAKDIISCDSEEIWEEWAKIIDRYKKHGPKKSWRKHVVPGAIDHRTSRDLWLEQLLKSVWEKHILKNLSKREIGIALLDVASSSCSVVLAKALIDHGAAVDYRKDNGFLTPLRLAARQTTQEAAELMKFLLLCGADSEASSTKIKKPLPIGEEKGAMGISKWLGISWDELVTQTREERAKQEEKMKKQEEGKGKARRENGEARRMRTRSEGKGV